jgi:hypothetical protein
MTTRWPWVTASIAAVLALNPLGLDFISSAFFSSEALARNIAGPIVLTAMAILVTLILLEWAVRTLVLKRRARGTTTA